MAGRNDKSVHVQALHKAQLIGFGLVALFGGTIGLWAATSTLSGAVIAGGQFVVDSNVKKVQHPTGGIVGELKVREGDLVKAGDLLIRLDETVTRANLQIVAKQLDELLARQARLEAERDGRPALQVPEEFNGRGSDPLIVKLIEGERTLFEARRAAREGQKSQLRKRIAQLENEIEGLRAQQTSKVREAALIAEELKGVRELYQKNLIQLSRLSALEREAASLEGQRGQIVAAVAQAEGKISETSLQIIQTAGYGGGFASITFDGVSQYSSLISSTPWITDPVGPSCGQLKVSQGPGFFDPNGTLTITVSVTAA